MPLGGGDVGVRYTLHSAGERRLVQVIVTLDREEQLDVWTISPRRQRGVVLVHAESGFEQGSVAEIVLILQRAKISSLELDGSSRLRHEKSQPVVFIMIVVRKKAGGDNVAGGQVGLQLGQVVHAPDVVTIRTEWELHIRIVVKLAVQGVDKPHPSLDNRTRKGVNGRPFAVKPALGVPRSRHEVRRG